VARIVAGRLELVAWRLPLIRGLRALPQAERESAWLGIEAEVRPTPRHAPARARPCRRPRADRRD
jgi:hypothetical protein